MGYLKIEYGEPHFIFLLFFYTSWSMSYYSKNYKKSYRGKQFSREFP